MGYRDPMHQVVLAAMSSLVNMQPKGTMVTTTLAHLLSSSGLFQHANWRVRRCAIQTLATLPKFSDESFAILVEPALTDLNSKVRKVAIGFAKCYRRGAVRSPGVGKIAQPL